MLVVDDRPEILRALSRFLGRVITTVLVAGTAEEAEVLLAKHQPALLLCDYWLGPECPPGTVLIERWRASYPCIVRAGLMTGTKATAILPTPGVDRVFQKPLKMPELTAWLLEGFQTDSG